MSDLCMYELEDNVWDEFCVSDDHIVPHTGNQSEDQYPGQSDDSHKKKKCEANSDKHNAYNTNKFGLCGTDTLSIGKNTVLEKSSWSYTPGGVFPSSCDSESIREASNMSDQCFKTGDLDTDVSDFCTDDPIMADGSTADDNGMFCYPVNQISQPENDLSFLGYNQENNEGSDLLFYGWPDIENFDDVDRMFRSCDSTFGLGSLSNEEELCWFSPSDSTNGSEDALKSSFNPTCSEEGSALKNVPDPNKNSMLVNENPSITEADKKVYEASAPGHFPLVNGFDQKSNSRDGSAPNEQITAHRKPSKHQNHLGGKRRDRKLGNGIHQVFSPPAVQHYKQEVGSDSSSYSQTHDPYESIQYSNPSDQISVSSTLSGAQSVNKNGLISPLKRSSNSLDQIQAMDNSCVPFDTPSIRANGNREKQFNQDLQSPLSRDFKLTSKTDQMMTRNAPVSIQKQELHSDEIDGHSEIEGLSVGVQAELDSANLLESSCMSSVLDEISLEASSFRQLQQVMEQLDIRTKLCIRDSLYRLAWSAEQRHICADPNINIGEDKDANSASMAHETNKCTGFLDIETETNPIDRSIAHLLFHRPSDPSMKSANTPLSMKSRNLNHESVTSQHAMTEKKVFPEETVQFAT